MTQWIVSRTAFRVVSATLLSGALFISTDGRTLTQANGQVLAGKNISLSGYVETSYTQNFNNPSTGVNNMRSFDGDANSFRPNMMQLVLEQAAKSKGGWKERTGFRVKLNVGEDAKFTGGDSGDQFDFQETYIQYAAPIGNGVTFQAGRMNTLIGYEVIESPLNANFSRSFLFGMGEPFTVTGLRASYDINDRVSIAGSIINDFTGTTVDENNSKSIEALLSYAPMDNLGLFLFGFWGPEGGRNNNPDIMRITLAAGDEAESATPITTLENTDRVQFGGILDWQVTDKLEFVMEGYYGNKANAVITEGRATIVATDAIEEVEGIATNIGSAQWGGLASYVIYDFTDTWGIRVRTEYFSDPSGFFSCGGGDDPGDGRDDPDTASGNALRCGIAPGDSAGQSLWETTWTLQYKPVDDFITRLEYRYDKSTRNSFRDRDGLVNNQSTLAVEAIYLF